jgi:hypothetical protein
MGVRKQRGGGTEAPAAIPWQGGQILPGRMPSQSADPSALPKFEPSEVRPYQHPFVYIHHADKGWEFVVTKKHPTGEWLPSLKAFRLQPGANRVREGRSTGLAFTWLASCGFAILPIALGPGGNYVREHDVVMKPKGVVTRIYLEAWAHIQIHGDEAVKVFNMAGYREWLRGLLADKHTRPPSPMVLQRAIRIKSNRVERLKRLPTDNAATTERIGRENKLLDLMRGSFSTQFGYDPTDLEAGYEALAATMQSAFPSQDDERPVEPA